ncbi:MAG: D-alanyl-D-alanine carboxypeptidase [Alphaproteobacteria bacterium]|nr:D-alanyl-D-alanine carboxypeptidase [Alphaproteobacteria bacterium]
MLASTPSLAKSNFATNATSAILVDYKTGAILYQKNADSLIAPASMSKLMTLAVLFKAIEDGTVKPTDEFVMSVNAWRTGGAPSGTSAMFVPVNKTATVEELIKGIVIQSGNDACIAVAEAMSGTEAAFAERMTSEARRIGLKKSTFKNATGLDQDGHLMTVRELAHLATYLIKTYPQYYPMFSERLFKYRRHKFYNRNPLLSANMGIDGLKTGHTSKAGYGIVVSGVNEGRRLIGVVSGLKTAAVRKAEARKLMAWGYRAFAKFKLFEADEDIGYARVWGGSSMYVPLTSKGPLEVILPRYPANQKLKGEIVYQGPIKPPIAKGQKVAKLRVTSSTSAVSEVPLYAKEDVEKATFVRQGFDSLLYLALGLLPL